MKFLNWLAPDLWWRLSVTSHMNPRNHWTQQSYEQYKNTPWIKQYQEILAVFQWYTWLFLKRCRTLEHDDPSDVLRVQSRDVGMTAPVPVHTHTYTHTVECSHSFFFCFGFFFQTLCYFYRRQGVTRTCRALPFVICEQVYISGKRCISLYCVSSVSQQYSPFKLSAASCEVFTVTTLSLCFNVKLWV